jgi:thiosulfate/3-mercaptopyruvate sulfurtransferase
MLHPIRRVVRTFVVIVAVASAAGLGGCSRASGDTASSAEPWGANTVSAPDLVKELGSADKPSVVCVAPAVLYRTGHVPGAKFFGPGSSPAALDELKTWAKNLPRTANIVVYCGCCPLEVCPNLRPAYAALQGMGFRRLRVLVLPTDFGTDWVRQGYPVER